MKACGHCEERAEWSIKDGWGVLACAEWFKGKCEGEPLDVASLAGKSASEGAWFWRG
jgi:hypothetical protein